MQKACLLFLLLFSFLNAGLGEYFEDNTRANLGITFDERKILGVQADYSLNFLGNFSLGITLIDGLNSTKFSLGDESSDVYAHLDYDVNEDLLIFAGYGIEAYAGIADYVKVYSYGVLAYFHDILYFKVENIHRIETFNDDTLLFSLGISLDRNYRLYIK